MEGVAAAYALQGEPAALQGAVFLDGLKRVLGAGGDKAAAGRRQRGYPPPVKPYHRNKEPLHALFALPEQAELAAGREKFALKPLVISPDAPRAGYDYQIVPAAKPAFVQPVYFAQPAPHAVAHNGAAELVRDGEAEPVARPAVSPCIYNKAWLRRAPALAVGASELIIELERVGKLQLLPLCRRAPRWVLRDSVGEAGSALRAAAGEDLAAVAGGHSLAEAVLLLALTLLGLVGANHSQIHPFLTLYSTAARGLARPQ